MRTIMAVHHNPISTFIMTVVLGCGAATVAAKMFGLF